MANTESGILPPPICTVVVPCFDEASRLSVNSFLEFLSSAPGVRFLFVNDGSRDDTLAMLRRLEALDPVRLEVRDQQPNQGKGEAVRTGMLHALQGSAIVGFWDADLATPLDAILELRSQLQRNPQLEMVFGSRVRLLGRNIERNPLRHYLGRIFATAASTVLRVPIYDTQCGAKLFRSSPSLASVLAQPFQSRWIFDVEIIARFLALHRSDSGYGRRAIYECPLDSWKDVRGSKVGPLDFFSAFWELLRIHAHYPH